MYIYIYIYIQTCGKIIDLNGDLFIAMFHCRRVKNSLNWACHDKSYR